MICQTRPRARLCAVLAEAARIGTMAAADCLTDEDVTNSFSMAMAAQKLLGIRNDEEEIKREELATAFKPLFEWRDCLTDAWGEDLVSMLAGLGGDTPDFRLPPTLGAMWKAFGKLDEDKRWAHAEAYVIATEGEVRKCWPT